VDGARICARCWGAAAGVNHLKAWGRQGLRLTQTAVCALSHILQKAAKTSSLRDCFFYSICTQTTALNREFAHWMIVIMDVVVLKHLLITCADPA
jgi:hypothetical protein